MLIFIDESGDAGFKITKGSSKCLVICLVCFEDNLEAEKTAVAIKELRRELGWSDSREFKFAKTSSAIRARFLSSVTPFKFKVYAVVFEKELIYSEHLRKNKEDFYRYAVKKAIESIKSKLQDASIFLDGSGDRVFKKEFQTYLRKELSKDGDALYKKFKMVKKSHNNVLIQLADMCAGAINRSYTEGKPDQCLYREIIKPRIRNIWAFK